MEAGPQGDYSPELLVAAGLLVPAELLELSLPDEEFSEVVDAGLTESADELDESDEGEFDDDPVEVFAVDLSLRA
jgi:hypothetical protein